MATGGTSECPGCGRRFIYRDATRPNSCGALACRFRHGYWNEQSPNGAGEGEWSGLARMAAAREAADYRIESYYTVNERGEPIKVFRRSPGVTLSANDLDALTMFPDVRSIFPPYSTAFSQLRSSPAEEVA